MSLQVLSNDFEDFASSAMYPGGTIMVTHADYVLWDYDGKRPPDSQVAVKITGTPTDKSNEGNPVDIYWSVGPASEFQPVAVGKVGTLHGKQMQTSSNWGFVLEKFGSTCGLEKGKLNGDAGITLLVGSEITFARVDQPVRAGLDDEPQMPGEPKKQKRTILIPTRCRFAWESGAGKGRAAAATAAVGAAVAPSASAASNGTAAATAAPPSTGSTLTDAIARVIASGPIPFSDLPSKLVSELKNVKMKERLELLAQAKDENAMLEMAVANKWEFDGETLKLAA